MTVLFNKIQFVLSRIVILSLKAYQTLLSPLFGNTCRFSPTCSNYMIEAIEKKGILIGIGKGVFRILRCHPWGESGYDPVR